MSNCLQLKKSNCKHCYKCIRNCPIKAIKFSGNQAHIINDECILCGQCFVVCPQNAKEIVDEREKVRVLIESGQPVIASIAPSFVANYNGHGIESLKKALLKLGFADVEETAIGATIVKTEYERILNEECRDVLISSCCHSINLLIQKHYPKALEYLCDIVSPMQAHAMDIKKRIPNAQVVFIGPCVAKKDEASIYEAIVDATLTFEQLTNWLNDHEITLGDDYSDNQNTKARIFPTTGGILKTMTNRNEKYTYLAVDGVQNCIEAIKDIIDGKIHNCFIEMSACSGSCIGGPVIEKYHNSTINDYITIQNYAGEKDFDVEMPRPVKLKCHFPEMKQKEIYISELEIMNVLRQMGKFKPSQELNCGSCGYNTCRDKARAVLEGKAEISMCLPFLKEKAESFSDIIVNNTPNGLILLNEDLEIQQINASAREIMNIKNEKDVLGEGVVRILDPTRFIEARNSKNSVKKERVYLAEYNRYVEQTIVYDEDTRLILGIMSDITTQERERAKKENIGRETIQVADRVIEKQMSIVQEIASLLGETAAETKIALTKLKETINYD